MQYAKEEVNSSFQILPGTLINTTENTRMVNIQEINYNYHEDYEALREGDIRIILDEILDQNTFFFSG